MTTQHSAAAITVNGLEETSGTGKSELQNEILKFLCSETPMNNSQ